MNRHKPPSQIARIRRAEAGMAALVLIEREMEASEARRADAALATTEKP